MGRSSWGSAHPRSVELITREPGRSHRALPWSILSADERRRHLWDATPFVGDRRDARRASRAVAGENDRVYG